MTPASLLAGLLLVTAPLAAQHALARTVDFPDVRDSSFIAANGERTQRLSILVPATPHAVWQALSTEAGWKSWAVATAYVDFREGGDIETSYNPGMPRGDRNNIRNEIIAFVPDALLVFHNVQAPVDFKDPDLFSRVITSIRLEPAEDGQTLVTISGAGYGSGAAFDDLYARFLWGNAYSLEEMRNSFGGGDATAETPAPVLPDSLN